MSTGAQLCDLQLVRRCDANLVRRTPQGLFGRELPSRCVFQRSLVCGLLVTSMAFGCTRTSIEVHLPAAFPVL